jgi:hypothetical protein
MTATLSHDLPTDEFSTAHDRSSVSSVDGPLSSGHLNQLDEANRSAAKLRRAAGVAAVSGWSLVVFSVLALPFGFFDVLSLFLGLALAAIGCNELRGRRLLLEFNLSGPGILGQNQLTLMGVLVVYGAWSIFTTLTDPTPVTLELQKMAEVDASIGALTDLYTNLTVAIYGVVIICSVIFQGSHAIYYFSRLRHLKNHLEKTPAWVLELQRMTHVTARPLCKASGR